MKINKLIFKKISQAPVAHACNPSDLGGSDQEAGFDASPGKEFRRPYLKNTHHKKRACGGGSRYRP
jgi:hypothetical protein